MMLVQGKRRADHDWLQQAERGQCGTGCVAAAAAAAAEPEL